MDYINTHLHELASNNSVVSILRDGDDCTRFTGRLTADRYGHSTYFVTNGLTNEYFKFYGSDVMIVNDGSIILHGV